VSPGTVYLFHSSGTAHGVASGGAGLASSVLTGSLADNAEFGISLAIADLNGDGYSDLIVGDDAGGELGEGTVYVFKSGATAAGIPSGDTGTAATRLFGTDLNFVFGAFVAVGDINGDAKPDLVVADPGGDSGDGCFCGAVYVFHNAQSGAGVPNGPSDSASGKQYGSLFPNATFGWTVATGDVDGDGYDDVVTADVGAEDPNGFVAGAAYLLRGSGTGIAGGFSGAADATIVGRANFGDQELGDATAISDLNGDGFADVVVSDADAQFLGAVYVFQASGHGGIPSSGTSIAHTVLLGPPEPIDESWEFGKAVQ
jgi:hypothetical protein